MCMFALQSFRWSISLMSSQLFPAWSALWTRVWLRQCDLASARHAQLSFKISDAVSISLSQSSNLVVSDPSKVVISQSKVRFSCLSVAHRLSVYCCIAVCMGSSTGLQVEHGFSIRASCCNFSVRCASSSVSAGGLVEDPSWSSLSWSCWKCSCNCARSLWGWVSSLYSEAVSPSRSGMLWVDSVVSRRGVSWGQAFPQHHHTWQFDPLVLLSCCGICGMSHNCGTML